MSVEALSWLAQDAPDVKPHWMGTLFGLCNTANERGQAYPAQALLAWYARKDERAVREDLRAMEAAGLIRKGDQRMVLHLDPDKRPVVWQLAMDRVRPPRPEPGRPGRPRKRGGPEIPPEAGTPPVSPETGGAGDPPGCQDPPVFDLGKQGPDEKRGGPEIPQSNLRTEELLLLPREGERRPAPSGAPNPPAPVPPDLSSELTADEQTLLAEVCVAAPRWSPASVRRVIMSAEIRQRTDRLLVRVAFLMAAGDVGGPGRPGTLTPRRLLHDACPFWDAAERQLRPGADASPEPVRLNGRVPWCGDAGCDPVTRTAVVPETGNAVRGMPRCPSCHPQSPAVLP